MLDEVNIPSHFFRDIATNDDKWWDKKKIYKASTRVQTQLHRIYLIPSPMIMQSIFATVPPTNRNNFPVTR